MADFSEQRFSGSSKMKLLSIAFRNVGGQNKCSASPELKEREQSEFKQCKWKEHSHLWAICHEPQIYRRLDLGERTTSKILCAAVRVHLKYLQNWTTVSCANFCHHSGRNSVLFGWALVCCLLFQFLLMGGCPGLALPATQRNPLCTHAWGKPKYQSCQSRCALGWARNTSHYYFLVIFYLRFRKLKC